MENSMTLFGITSEQQSLLAALELNEGELTPELEQALAINEGNFIAKADGYAKAIAHYNMVVEACKSEKDRINKMQKQCERVQDILKDKILQAMELFDKKSIEVGCHKLSTRKSQSVVVDDPDVIDNRFKIFKPEISKTAIKEAIKNGELVEGAHIEDNVSLILK